MQLHCSFCQTMFAISRDEMLAALQHMEQEGLKYYDAHCPKCRRANRVEGKRIEVFFPEWKQALKAAQAAAKAGEDAAPAAAKPKPPARAEKPGASKPQAKGGGKAK